MTFTTVVNERCSSLVKYQYFLRMLERLPHPFLPSSNTFNYVRLNNISGSKNLLFLCTVSLYDVGDQRPPHLPLHFSSYQVLSWCGYAGCV